MNRPSRGRLVCLVVGALSLSLTAWASPFIVDDFDSPNVGRLPSGAQVTRNVGATDGTTIDTFGQVPELPSAFVWRIDRFGEPTRFTTFQAATLGFLYSLPGEFVDASGGGLNDTLHIDFNAIRANHPFLRISPLVQTIDSRGIMQAWGTDVFDPTQSEGPIRFSFPLAEFQRSRGFASAEPLNPARLAQVALVIEHFDATLPSDFGLYVEIDRIWLGPAIPEPGAATLAVGAALAGGLSRRRRGR